MPLSMTQIEKDILIEKEYSGIRDIKSLGASEIGDDIVVKYSFKGTERYGVLIIKKSFLGNKEGIKNKLERIMQEIADGEK